MKIRYISSVLLLAALGMSTTTFTSCSDDDVTVATEAIIKTVETGDAAVTAISAQTTGTVLDLSGANATSYSVGVVYGTSEDVKSTGAKAYGSIDANGIVTTDITGLSEGTTYYYAQFVSLQGLMTYYGDVKSFVATDAEISTDDATEVTATKLKISGSVIGADGIGEYETGVKLGLDAETLTATGKDYKIGEQITALLPGTKYYYTTYAKIGDGYIYGPVKEVTTLSQAMSYVDLGLSVMWADCNIGAETASEVGTLFGYGDKTGMNTSQFSSQYASADIAATADDIISNLSLDDDSPMSSAMPTAAQIAELVSGTTQSEETVDGVSGVRFTAPNGNSIFMPYTGYRDGENVVNDGLGHYWSGTINATDKEYATSLKLTSGNGSKGTSKTVHGLALRTVRPYSVLTPESSKLIVGDIEGNGNVRIELYNEYGSSKSNPAIDPTTIKFKKNMVVTFNIKGIDGNLKSGEGVKGTYVAGLEYTAPGWAPSYWSSLAAGFYETTVAKDGQYTVWMETESDANGALVFCVDIGGLAADLVDISKLEAEIVSIKLDADVDQVINSNIVEFQNKDGNGVDGRIEIYNEYGNSGTSAKGYYNKSLKFRGMVAVDFTISGIDGNLVDGASKSYKTELSYAAASWSPSYWGGAAFGGATVTGDGSYRVFAYLNDGDCEGAVVWTIELYNLWKDLVDTSKVQVKIDRVVTPGKK
ncbi:MAG: hypothetical protein K6E54_04160 [Bacteroidaceae bacterium]|nr:hypothetical protein [Bacteroidaceae bacterium]